MAQNNEYDGQLGCEAPDVDRVKAGPPLAKLSDRMPRPRSEFAIACINAVDRFKEWVRPPKTTAEIFGSSVKPPKASQVEALVVRDCHESEYTANYSLRNPQ